MFGFQPIAFNYQKLSLAACVTLTWIASNPTISGTAGSPLSYDMNLMIATGTVTTWTFSGLPLGLTGNTSTGVISGTVVAEGTYTANVTAINSCTSPAISRTISISIGPGI